MSHIRETIARRFKQARQARGLTLQEVTDLLGGSSPSRYAQWESGDRTPKYEQVLDTAKALNFPAAWLAGFSDDDGTGARADEYQVPANSLGEGAGSIDADQLTDAVAYRGSYLLRRGLSASSIITAKATDDGLAPEIRKGDDVLIDRDATKVTGSDVFAVWAAGRLLFRRISLDVDGSYLMAGGDSQGESKRLTAEQFKDLEIVGRVARHSRDI